VRALRSGLRLGQHADQEQKPAWELQWTGLHEWRAYRHYVSRPNAPVGNNQRDVIGHGPGARGTGTRNQTESRSSASSRNT
jgi:hypothetical protein